MSSVSQRHLDWEDDSQGRLERIETPAAWHWLSYDDAGELVQIRYQLRGTSPEDAQTTYRRLTPSLTRHARELVKEVLPGRIREWATRVAPGTRVYALALSYDPDAVNGGPNLGLATFAELEHWKRTLPPQSLPTVAWNPAEFGLLDVEPREIVKDAELVDAFQILSQQAATRPGGMQELMVAVAADLARQLEGDDGALAQVAVYATDLELQDLEVNLRASVPASTRELIGI